MGKPDYPTMVKSRGNCFIIFGCCVITGTGSNMVCHFDFYVMSNPFGSPNSVDAILRNVSAILEQQEQLDYKESYTTTHGWT